MSEIQDRYKAAYREEYEAMKAARMDDRAAGVAKHYKALYGEDLDPVEEEKPETTREEKPPEKAVPAKPGPARKPSQK